ncbi:cation:proton antiporter [Aquiflexum sp. TKW24L]|uniref:cation:proton antiporter domain-containing protein n=1 Tax=Aquiflexum sp. TKW24L TaxID=2942212 RepID=UPI0020BF3891|nr:cation:proton antiporter [Aquiflexum sp. TKW24L]MCL6257634.1 cation:proton antiporter [Aquiflexum sp. TKW24L]
MDIYPFYHDAIWLASAFICGVLAKRIGLPPLVGFLIAGFLINFSGLQEGNINSGIEALADIGVMILLFTIGLKLKLKELFRPEILVSATLHMVLIILGMSGMITLLMYFGISIFSDLSMESTLMLSFALSFSSTVFVVKTLEARGEMASYHGRIAIGILVIQDIFAVLFIAFSDKKIPSLWILALPIVLWLLHKILSRLLHQMEHGELFSFFGFFAIFVAGAMSFNLVGLKADLGALVIGMLLVNHPRVDELYSRMTEYKDFFLIAFFINVGMVGLPSFSTFGVAMILLPFALLKGGLFLLILSRFSLQPRTAFLSALGLTNFSEFGLIVGIVGLQVGLLTNEWVVAMAILMSLSFVLAAPLNVHSHAIFDRFKGFILKLNRNKESVDCEPLSFGNAEVLVVGLGSVGMPTFHSLQNIHGDKVLGLDFNPELVAAVQHSGHNALWADVTDSELWDNVDCKNIKAVFMTVADFNANIQTITEIDRIKDRPFKIFALSRYSDQAEKYRSMGVDYVFEYKENLGYDFVSNTMNKHSI